MNNEQAALQKALAAEHAAVYAYGVLGGVLGTDSTLATAGYAAHRGRRDLLIGMIGPQSVAPEPAYELPFRVTDTADAERLAILTERRCTRVYAEVVSETTGDSRMRAAQALAECALRAVEWGAEPEPFPGLGFPSAGLR